MLFSNDLAKSHLLLMRRIRLSKGLLISIAAAWSPLATFRLTNRTIFNNLIKTKPIDGRPISSNLSSMPIANPNNFWCWLLDVDMIAIVEPGEGSVGYFFRYMYAFIGIRGEYLGGEESSASDGILCHGFDLGFELHY